MLILPKEKLFSELKSACSSIPQGPVVIHSDLSVIGMTASPRERNQILMDYEEALNNALGKRTLLVPVFNYDFCKNGIYDRLNAPSQVGALSDYFRIHYVQERSYTPIFNFVIRNNDGFSSEPSKHVFGKDSIFATLHKQKGSVLFLGADFSTNTFIHYVEECQNVGYRYQKNFAGKIIDGNVTRSVEVQYRVRPLSHPEAVIYDWTRLIGELKQQKILHDHRVGYGTLLYYNAAELFEFWQSKMNEDEFYLLTTASRNTIRTLANTKGYPFQLKMFE